MKRKKFLYFIIIISLSIFFSCSEDDSVGQDVYEPKTTLKTTVYSSEEIITDSYHEIKAWFDYMCSPELGGRYSGSKGIGKALEYISDIIGKSDSLEIDTFETDKCEMRNVIYHIKGTSDSLIV